MTKNYKNTKSLLNNSFLILCWLILGCRQHLEDFEGRVNGGL